MCLLDAGEGACVLVYKMQVVQCIGLREVCTVVENGASQAVTARKVMVDFARVEVLVPNLAGRYAVVSNISRRIDSGIRQRPEAKIARYCRIYRDIAGREDTVTRVLRRYTIRFGNSKRLPQTLVVGKEERLVTKHGSAKRAAELVAPEGCNCRGVEVVPRVERAVTNELVRAAAKLIGSGTRDCVDYTARCLSVLCGVIRRNHRELLNGIDTGNGAQHTAGSAVGVVVEADPIETVVVLLRPRTRDAHLVAKAAEHAIYVGSARAAHL